jgi:hypothetical protein
MESIQQPDMALEPSCCSSNTSSSSHAKLMRSMTKAIAVLMLATILSHMSRQGYANNTCPTNDGPAKGVLSFVSALTTGTSTAVATSHSAPLEHGNHVSIPLRPIVVELGAVALLQMIGFPVLGRVAFLMRRVNLMRLGRHLHVPTPVLRQLSRQVRVLTRTSAKLWKTAESIYSKTSLSKLVQRIKKLLKIVSHVQEDEEESDASGSHSH